jgi:hypothetical protein
MRGFRSPGVPLKTARQQGTSVEGHSDLFLDQTQEDYWGKIDEFVEEIISQNGHFRVLKSFYLDYYNEFNRGDKFTDSILAWDKGRDFLEGLVLLYQKMREAGYTHDEIRG